MNGMPRLPSREADKRIVDTFNSPQCLYCTARLIQRIGKLRTPTSDAITARRRVVLSDAVTWGHEEALIRKLAKGPICYQPEVRK